MYSVQAGIVIIILVFVLCVLLLALFYSLASSAHKDDTIAVLSEQLSDVSRDLKDLQAESVKFINMNTEYANSINELSNEYMREALRAKFYANLNNSQEKQKDDTAS